MKISLGSWAFSFGPYADNPIPFDRTARRMSEAGYDGIEVCGFPPHITLDRYPTKESRRELVFRRNVEMCAEIGSPAIRVDTIAAPGSIADADYQAAFVRVATLWAEAAEIAQRGGIRMVWEFEPGFVFNKPSEVVAMHDKVGHPNFKVLFDTSHAYMCGVVGARQHGAKETLAGGVPEFLKKLEGRIGHIHLIDSDGTLHGDETSTHRPFGEGYIDFKGLAPQLLEVPGIEWWCIDLCFWADAWDLVEPSLEFVADLIDTKQAA
jgi:sugar phosphate isomerase/epimerase